MIDSAGKAEIPSMLREPGGRHDTIQKRILVAKNTAENLGLHAPTELSNDEHYWFTVLKRDNIIRNYLKDNIKDHDQLRITSLSLAMNETEELLKLEKLRATDGLTNAWSRSALDNFLRNLIARPRDGYEIGVFFIDVDYFKKINDTKGHAVGDEVLKSLVGLLKDNVRGADMVARYGGEELVVVLPNIEEEVASAIIKDKAEAFRTSVAEYLGITVSIGATTVHGFDREIKDVYTRADSYMYKAKESGRNATCVEGNLVLKHK